MEMKHPNIFTGKIGRILISIGTVLLILSIIILGIGLLAALFSAVIILFAVVFTLGLILLDPDFISKIQAQNELASAISDIQSAVPYLAVGWIACWIVGILLTRSNRPYLLSRRLGFGMAVQVEGGQIKYDKVGNITVTLDDTSATAKIYLKSFLELDRPGWFLHVAFFWLIGIFGLFTPKYERWFPTMDNTLEIQSDGSSTKKPQLDITFYHPKKGETSLTLKTNNCKIISEMPEGLKQSTLNSSVYTQSLVTNTVIRKRTRLVKLFSRVLRLALIAALIFLIVASL